MSHRQQQFDTVPQEGTNQRSIQLQQQIKQEFNTTSQKDNSRISMQDMQDFLDKKSQKQFDKALVQQIYQSSDQQRKGFISIEQMAEGYVRYENRLTNELNSIQQQLQKGSLKKREMQQHLQESKVKKSDQVKLSVIVRSAKNLAPVQGGSNYFCILECENQKFNTQIVKNDLNPEWEESFIFEVQQQFGSLDVLVVDDLQNNFQSSLIISLSDLQDEQKHQDWYKLQGYRQDGKQGEIHLILQLTKQVELFYQNYINQLEQKIQEEQNEFEEYQQKLKTLKEPFEQPSIISNLLQTRPQEKVYVAYLDDQVEAIVDKFGFKGIQGQGRFHWGQAAFILSFVFTSVTVFAMFLKPDFPNLMIGLAAIFLYLEQNTSQSKFRYLSLGIILTILYDLIWMFIYMSVTIQYSALTKW